VSRRGGDAHIGTEREANDRGGSTGVLVDRPPHPLDACLEREPRRAINPMSGKIYGDAAKRVREAFDLRMPHTEVGAGPMEEDERVPGGRAGDLDNAHNATR
jgi:hypothetical protein